MNKRLVECVPNFSEGRDMGIIKEITDAITSVEGIKLLDVDPGQATNRTVVTFVGEPEAVAEAAFRGWRSEFPTRTKRPTSAPANTPNRRPAAARRSWAHAISSSP